MVVTSHAKKRMKQRCGFSKKLSKKMARKAFEHGLRHKDLVGGVHKWVSALYLSQRKANNIMLYGNQAYLFHHSVLITVITVPNGCLPSLRESEMLKKKKEKEMIK